MGFPIFRVPSVPFREILRMMEFSDLISISLCSQRCHNATKWNLYKLKEWEICVVADWDFEIILRKGEEECVILRVSFGKSLSERQHLGANIESCRIGNTLFRVAITQGYLTSYWPTERIGMFESGKYVADLFQKEIHTVKFRYNSTWLMELPSYIPQLSISKVVFDFFTFRDDQMSSVLRVLEECSAEHLEIHGYFVNAPRLIRYGNFRTFCAMDTWMTVRHVTTLKCSHISLPVSLWNCVHVNKFLRRWIHRGMPKLEYFDLYILYDIHIEDILDGLNQFVLSKSSDRGRGKNDEWCTFHQLQIKSKNGSIASVDVNTSEKVFRMTVN
ncbi:unnamed protein product [Caenorhabditis brenneri]